MTSGITIFVIGFGVGGVVMGLIGLHFMRKTTDELVKLKKELRNIKTQLWISMESSRYL